MRRLSVIHLQVGGSPYMTGALAIVFNGKVYKFQSLRRRQVRPYFYHGFKALTLPPYSQARVWGLAVI
jgi:hypothetical protein